MDVGTVVAVIAGLAGAAAARKKRKKDGTRKSGGWLSSLDALAPFPLERLLTGAPVSPGGASVWTRPLGRSRLDHSVRSVSSPSRRTPSAPPPFRATRRPGRAEMEREGIPHPLIVRRRRARRRELLREMMNVGMGSAAIGVSTAGLLFDGGISPDWSLVAGGLAAIVFGWILGREVLGDLIHLGS